MFEETDLVLIESVPSHISYKSFKTTVITETLLV
jgi:hypothetical protein